MTRAASAPQIRIDPSLSVPPYEQVRGQIADLVASGALPAGTRLPPVRQLATDLGLAAGTVARAYQELESAGLVQTRRGGGTLVADGVTLPPARRRELLADRAREYVAAARRLGADDDEARAAVGSALRP